jgi:hypothetical protein
MALHPHFPASPYAPLIPEQRWFPADETMRATAYEKLLPPLVAKIRTEVFAWRNKGYAARKAEEQKLGFKLKPVDVSWASMVEPLVHRGDEKLPDVLAWLTEEQKKGAARGSRHGVE